MGGGGRHRHGELMVLSLSRRRGVTEAGSQWGGGVEWGMGKWVGG